jgi:hypothetical protein
MQGRLYWLSIIIGAAGLLLASVSQGSLIAYDSFDYTSGTAIAAGETLGSAENGFGNAWLLSGLTGEVVSGLDYSGVASAGNALKITGDGGYLFRGMSPGLSAGTYYISYLFYRSDVEGWNLQLKTSSSYGTGPTSGTKLLTTFDSSPVGRSRIKVGGSGTVGVSDVADYFTYGTTNLALIKLVITDTDTTAYMNIYNDGEVVDTASWVITSSDSVTGGAGWRLGVSGTSSLTIDEFKIGTELGDVIPEPATIGLIGVGTFAAFFVRRRIVK